MTLDCGHNFCNPCIQECWEDLEDVFLCPVCLQHSPDNNIKKNTQLCHITDIVKQLPITMSKCKIQEEELVCDIHNELLDLFCEEDLELLCPQCRAFSNHRNHQLIPIENVIASQRKKFKRCMKTLRGQIEDFELKCKSQATESFELRKKIENLTEELVSEFEEFKIFLKKKQFSIITDFGLEENNAETNIKTRKLQILKHISIRKNLLSEITMKTLQSDMDLLRIIGNVHDRYEQLFTPDICSYELKKGSCILPPHYFGLHRMMSTFQVELTLNPETAHPSITVSEDRKSLILNTSLPSSAEYTTENRIYPAVLCCESFDNGRHFWQVEVRGSGQWSLGLCTELMFRDQLMKIPNQKSSYWTFYESKRNIFIQGTEDREQVERFGAFLDVELGEFSVYNLSKRKCLYKYTDQFTDKLMPYFAIESSASQFSITLTTEITHTS